MGHLEKAERSPSRAGDTKEIGVTPQCTNLLSGPTLGSPREAKRRAEHGILDVFSQVNAAKILTRTVQMGRCSLTIVTNVL